MEIESLVKIILAAVVFLIIPITIKINKVNKKNKNKYGDNIEINQVISNGNNNNQSGRDININKYKEED